MTGQWVGWRVRTASLAEPSDVDGVQTLEAGWILAHLREMPSLPDLDRHVTQLIAAGAERAFGAYVEDSDFAYLVLGGLPGGHLRMLVNPLVADGTNLGSEAIRQCSGRPNGEEAPPAEDLAEWARGSGDLVIPELNVALARTWGFAEEGAVVVLRSLGVPIESLLPPSALLPYEPMKVGGRVLDFRMPPGRPPRPRRYTLEPRDDYFAVVDTFSGGIVVRTFPRDSRVSARAFVREMNGEPPIRIHNPRRT